MSEQQKEIREAINAGNLPLTYLNNARQELNSASNFGIADMLGIDLIGGIGKHMKMRNANEQLQLAKAQVMNFQRELQDVQGSLVFQVDVGGFLTFADFFFDGILADVLVQSKISDAKEQVDKVINHINAIMNDLYRMQSEA